jgi:hypothetical protein
MISTPVKVNNPLKTQKLDVNVRTITYTLSLFYIPNFDIPVWRIPSDGGSKVGEGGGEGGCRGVKVKIFLSRTNSSPSSPLTHTCTRCQTHRQVPTITTSYCRRDWPNLMPFLDAPKVSS